MRSTPRMIVVIGAFIAACADSTTPEPVGGETHFLHACDGSDACGLGLECICGVCTKPCTTDNTCKNENTQATCEPAGTPNGACVNPQASPVCDVECAANPDCNSLGTGYTCEQGSCRKLSAGACIDEGVLYSAAAVAADPCLACRCSDTDMYCSCDDGGMDAAVDSGNDAESDARTEDADVDAGPILVDSGLVASAVPACDADPDGGVGAFEPKEIDPTPVCVELDDLTALAGAQILAFAAAGIQTSTQSDTDILWTDNRNLFRVPKAGGIAERFLAELWDVRSLHVDQCNLYAATVTFTGSTLASRSLDDGAATAIAAFTEWTQASNIVTDSNHLYLLAGTSLQRVPRSGGPIITMASAQGSQPGGYDSPVLTASDSDLYWIGRNGYVMTMPKSGLARPRVVTSALPALLNIHWQDGYVYVLSAGNLDMLGNYVGGGGLIRIDPSNGDTLTLAEFPGAIDLASDDRHLYWMHSPSSNLYSVSRVALDQSEAPTPLHTNLRGNGRGLMVDDTRVYWHSECWGTGFTSNFIVSTPKPAPL